MAYPKIYQLKIALNGIKPPVWRRVLVSGDSTISFLHEIVQLVSFPFLNGSGALLVQPSRVRRSYRKETKAVDRMSESSDAELNKN
jgi:hypothetical protein